MPTDQLWVLRQDGFELARHSTRLACAVEAVERKLAVHSGRMTSLVEGVKIALERERDAD